MMSIENQNFVSVIIPAHRAMSCLRDCLEALSRQSFDDACYEVIVVDNGDNEGIDDLISEYGFSRCIEEKRPGSYSARNGAIGHAKGNLLAFTDADCVPDKEWLAEGVRALSGAGRVGIVGGRIELTLPAADDKSLNATQIYEKYFSFDQKDYVERKRFAATANMFTTRQVVEETGAFDARLFSGGDLEFGNRVADAGYAVRFADRAIIRHRARDSLEDLMAKARRLAGGEVMLARLGIRQHTLRDWINIVAPPLVLSWRLASTHRIPAPVRSRLIAIGVLNLLHLVAFIERAAIYCGKTPRR